LNEAIYSWEPFAISITQNHESLFLSPEGIYFSFTLHLRSSLVPSKAINKQIYDRIMEHNIPLRVCITNSMDANLKVQSFREEEETRES
jgi:hypothetical protein